MEQIYSKSKKEIIDEIVECQRKLINLENKVRIQNIRIRKLQGSCLENGKET